jgi:hypothetical protein
MTYRKKHNIPVIYSSTLKIRDIYPLDALMFIVEMNNETDEIEGIGLIKNRLVYDKRYKIYENTEYNNYIYRGKYWISRKQIDIFNPEILQILDNILFKGKSHLKRKIGISVITEKVFVHWNYEFQTLKRMVKDLFINYYKHNNINEEFIEDVNINVKDEFTEDFIPNPSSKMMRGSCKKERFGEP